MERSLSLTAWLSNIVLPLWADRGRDARTGAFYERLLPDGTADLAAPLRVRVQLRQIYVFAHAGVLGWFPQGPEVALQAFERLMRTAHAPDDAPGFVHVLNPDGTVQNPLRDSYDHAFAVLALSWLARATGDNRVRHALDDTLSFVDRHLTAPDGSLLEGLPASQPRRQNPQMHWFEATLALKESIDHPEAEARIIRARSIFDRVYDPTSCTVGEYFTDAWAPVSGAAGDTVEPGHQAEWTWLLRKHERICGLPPATTANDLLESALRSADSVSGLLVDEADRQGRIRKATRRSWLQTELAKAWIAEAEIGVGGAADKARAALAALDQYYLRRPFAAGWIDALDATHAVVPGPVSASTLYHIFVAIAEGERVLGAA
jgi:mannose/cellobiose epimerase-like protein (N-acyl-D-glucosamine 2-epimerase family)